MKRTTFENNTITQTLTRDGFVQAKQNLWDSPEKLKLFEDKGISRGTVALMPIGLTEDNKLFTPLYNSE